MGSGRSSSPYSAPPVYTPPPQPRRSRLQLPPAPPRQPRLRLKAVEDAELVEDAEPVRKKRQLDCKDFAAEVAKSDSKLLVVRGYIVLAENGFTEHWWCQTKRGIVVDITPLAACDGQYLPLKERSAVPELLCGALNGGCQVDPVCEWCEVRYRLEADGHERTLINTDRGISQLRVVFDRLWNDGRARR